MITPKRTSKQTAAKRDPAAMRKRRLKAVTLFARGLHKAEIARQLGVARQSVGRWLKQHAEGGEKALRGAAKLGRTPKADAATLERFKAQLLKGPEAHGFANNPWTLKRMRDVLERTCGVNLHSRSLWHVMRAMKWSPQRPQAKARERDKAAIEKGRRHTWPALKKSPQGKALDRV